MIGVLFLSVWSRQLEDGESECVHGEIINDQCICEKGFV